MLVVVVVDNDDVAHLWCVRVSVCVYVVSDQHLIGKEQQHWPSAGDITRLSIIPRLKFRRVEKFGSLLLFRLADALSETHTADASVSAAK